jgi:hypothetical protein
MVLPSLSASYSSPDITLAKDARRPDITLAKIAKHAREIREGRTPLGALGVLGERISSCWRH